MSHSVTCKTVPIKSISAIKAAVASLREKGVNVELRENSKPRCYYNNQIKRQVMDLMDTDDKQAAKEASEGFNYNSDPDVCDYVIHCPDAYYDVGLIKHKDGHYVPFFDNYEHRALENPYFTTGTESGGISQTLGTGHGQHAGHWNGLKDSSDAVLHSIGQFLQEYTKEAAIETAISQGHSIEDLVTDEDGNIHLTVAI